MALSWFSSALRHDPCPALVHARAASLHASSGDAPARRRLAYVDEARGASGNGPARPWSRSSTSWVSTPLGSAGTVRVDRRAAGASSLTRPMVTACQSLEPVAA